MSTPPVNRTNGITNLTIVDRRLEDWRRRLIDLSYRNRLIKYRPLRASSLEIASPALDVLLADPDRRTPWSFYFPPDPDPDGDSDSEGGAGDTTEAERLVDDAVLARARTGPRPRANEIVLTEPHPKRINRTLENLARKSNAEFQDKALRVLYIAAGFLDWIDPTRDERLRSPLVLVPVRLERRSAAAPYQLFFVDDEEPVINPSLTEKLRYDANLDIPEDFAWEDKPILVELAEIQAAVDPHGWTVQHEAVLGLFSFQKYVMYRDLLDNEAIIARHPLVRSLAQQELVDDAQARIEVPEPAELDERQPAREVFSILDADASQRRCIEAAKRGQSFVMHGPPGTGKSQTIANIIAESISQGHKVLFVSEKAAALDVVHNRLRALGLGDFCLMLHGEHASRREVVSGLHASLTSELLPRMALSDVDLSRHDHLREYLNEQIATLHSAEPLLGSHTIREIYSTLATLHAAVSVPGAPEASVAIGEDVIREFEELRDVFGRLSERWKLSAPDYAWRDFDATRFSSDDRARAWQTVDRLKQATISLRQTAEIAAGRIGSLEARSLADFVPLIALCEHLQQAPAVAAHWLDVEMPARLRRAAAEALSAYKALDEGTRQFERLFAGRLLNTFPDDVAETFERARNALHETAGRTARWNQELVGALPWLMDALDELPKRCDQTQRRLADLCDALGQPDYDASIRRIDELVKLGRLAFDPPGRPEPDWLVRAGLERATSALSETQQLLEDFQRRRRTILDEWRADALAADVFRLAERWDRLSAEREVLLQSWHVDALALDVQETKEQWAASEQERGSLLTGWSEAGLVEDAASLGSRFRSDYTSMLSKLKSGYRQDAKRLKDLRSDGKLPDDPIAELERLADWQQDHEAIAGLISGVRVDAAVPDGLPGVLEPIAEYQANRAELDATIATLRIHGDVPDEAGSQLSAIAEAQEVGRRIDANETKWAIALGSYWQGRDTDVDAVAAACRTADLALGLRHVDSDMTILARQLCVGASSDPRLAQTADQLESAASGLSETLARVERFADRASATAAARTIRDIGHLAERITQPFKSLKLLVDDLQRSAIEPAQTLEALRDRAATISALHQAHTKVRASEQDWAAVIGPAFSGRDTDWAQLDVEADWLQELFRMMPTLTPRIREGLLAPEIAQWPDPAGIRQACDRYSAAAEVLASHFAEPRRTQLQDLVDNDLLTAAEGLCTSLLGSVDTLYDWTDLRHYRQRASEAGWDEFVANLIDADLTGDDVSTAFERAFWGRRLDALFNEEPELEEDFRGGAYQRFITEFQELDARLVRTGPDRLIAARNATMPRHVAIGNSEVAVLRTEAGKLRRHKPVRQLLAEIPNLLSQLKPCLMMSPLSVSHYLTASHRFDLVLFDEASQVPPQDAINCIYRGKQLIVAGDSHQLPPTSFFQVAELADAETEDAQEDMESVLDSCQALLPEYYLRWHYRSRHEDLIAFSNNSIYDGELVTFPTPDHLSPDMGVTFTFVPDGLYDRGKTQTNATEARLVAHRLVDYLRDGTGRSVGVIAFNSAQATAITNELDLLRVQDPTVDHFFSGDRLDGPFVKHLESVQGDERDVILFSVGYGRDSDGRFPMSFGPLNNTGGHRRLNVAITRARHKVELVASVTSKDFSLGEQASKGSRLLRDYLAYAERSAAHTDLRALGDSEHYAVTGVELEIAREVERLGFHAVHQVGAGSMRVDIAVIDPDDADRFVLAIGSDGPPYRATPTARDRDRLRDQVLRQLGWRLHRVWSLDWVRDRDGEVERLREALDRSASFDEHRDVDDSKEDFERIERVERVVVDLRDPATIMELPWVSAYVREEIGYRHARLEFHDPGERSYQCEVARRIVTTEAPLHIDYLIRRLAEVYGLQRVGNRVDAAARQAIRQATRSYGYSTRGDFLWRADQQLDVVRRPLDGDPRTRREIDQIPPQEIDLAFQRLLELSSGAGDEDLLVSVARIFGFDRTGERMRAVLLRRLRLVKRKFNAAS